MERVETYSKKTQRDGTHELEREYSRYIHRDGVEEEVSPVSGSRNGCQLLKVPRR